MYEYGLVYMPISGVYSAWIIGIYITDKLAVCDVYIAALILHYNVVGMLYEFSTTIPTLLLAYIPVHFWYI